MSSRKDEMVDEKLNPGTNKYKFRQKESSKDILAILGAVCVLSVGFFIVAFQQNFLNMKTSYENMKSSTKGYTKDQEIQEEYVKLNTNSKEKHNMLQVVKHTQLSDEDHQKKKSMDQQKLNENECKKKNQFNQLIDKQQFKNNSTNQKKNALQTIFCTPKIGWKEGIPHSFFQSLEQINKNGTVKVNFYEDDDENYDKVTITIHKKYKSEIKQQQTE